MYETICFFNENGSKLKDVLKPCIFSYYEKRFIYKS